MTTDEYRGFVRSRHPRAKVTKKRSFTSLAPTVYRIWVPDTDDAPDWPSAPTVDRAWQAAAEAINGKERAG